MEFLGTCSNKEVLKRNKRILQLKIVSLPVNMGDKNLCLLLNAYMVNLGVCLPLKCLFSTEYRELNLSHGM